MRELVSMSLNYFAAVYLNMVRRLTEYVHYIFTCVRP